MAPLRRELYPLRQRRPTLEVEGARTVERLRPVLLTGERAPFCEGMKRPRPSQPGSFCKLHGYAQLRLRSTIIVGGGGPLVKSEGDPRLGPMVETTGVEPVSYASQAHVFPLHHVPYRDYCRPAAVGRWITERRGTRLLNSGARRAATEARPHEPRRAHAWTLSPPSQARPSRASPRWQTAEEAEAAHRHRPEANPYTFFERMLMIRETVLDDGVALERVAVIPFPVNLPDPLVPLRPARRHPLRARLLRLGAGEGRPPARPRLRRRDPHARRPQGPRGHRRAPPARTGPRSSRPPSRASSARCAATDRARAVALRLLTIFFHGLGDRPVPELGGLTPLEAARTPNLDRLASEGITGLLHAKSPGYALGSPLALHLLFGYPQAQFPDRGPLLATARGVDQRPGQVALAARFACAVPEGRRLRLVQRFVTGREAACAALAAAIASYEVDGHAFRYVYSGRGDGLLLVDPPAAFELTDTDSLGLDLPMLRARARTDAADLPAAQRTAAALNAYLGWAHRTLAAHPAAAAAGDLPAVNCLLTKWAGPKPAYEPFARRWGMRAASLPDEEVVNGLMLELGCEVRQIPDADPEAGLRSRLHAARALRRGLRARPPPHQVPRPDLPPPGPGGRARRHRGARPRDGGVLGRPRRRPRPRHRAQRRPHHALRLGEPPARPLQRPAQRRALPARHSRRRRARRRRRQPRRAHRRPPRPRPAARRGLSCPSCSTPPSA